MRAVERDMAPPAQDQSVYAYYMATCVPGMARTLANELSALGCPSVELSGNSAVYFHVHHPETILQVLIWSRTAHKILELLCRTSEPVHTRDDIYQWIRHTVPVEDLLLNPIHNDGKRSKWLTLSVAVTLNNAAYIPSDINHSHYTALNIKNALVDAAREVSNDQFESDRPSVDVTDTCDVPLVVMLRGIPSSSYDRSRFEDPSAATMIKSSAGAHVSLFRCIHGVGSLHRRGYRNHVSMHKAALKESTAAGLLFAAGWHTKCQAHQSASDAKGHGVVLMDPMMGSGTFLLEGAMMAADIAPGIMRIKCGIPGAQSPPILRWNDSSNDSSLQQPLLQSIWNAALIDATKRAQRGIESFRERGIHIVGNDVHDASYELADRALRQAGLRNLVQLHCTDCADWKPTIEGVDESPWMIVTNPPWGVRLNDDMSASWEALRIFIRGEHSVIPRNGSEIWILSGNANSTKHLGLRRSQSVPLQTGEQNLRWLQYILREQGSSSSNFPLTQIFDENDISGSAPYSRHSNKYSGEMDDHRRNTRTHDRSRLTLVSNGRPGDRSHRPISNAVSRRIPSTKRHRPSSRPERTSAQKKPKTPTTSSREKTDNEWLI